MSSSDSAPPRRLREPAIGSPLILRRALAAVAVALLLAPGALAAGTATPNEIGLAKSLKAEMTKAYRTKAPGTKFTTVTCKISQDQTGAHCIAHFTRKTQSLKGLYRVTVAADGNGNAVWKAASAACTSTKTGAKVKC